MAWHGVFLVYMGYIACLVSDGASLKMHIKERHIHDVSCRSVCGSPVVE